jgi:hypothetical protein
MLALLFSPGGGPGRATTNKSAEPSGALALMLKRSARDVYDLSKTREGLIRIDRFQILIDDRFQGALKSLELALALKDLNYPWNGVTHAPLLSSAWRATASTASVRLTQAILNCCGSCVILPRLTFQETVSERPRLPRHTGRGHLPRTRNRHFCF